MEITNSMIPQMKEYLVVIDEDDRNVHSMC